MEGSFADAANNHGFKRSRWRGLEKVTIQNFLIAAVQNIRILIKHWRKPVGVALEMMEMARRAWDTAIAGAPDMLTHAAFSCLTHLVPTISRPTAYELVPT